MPKSYTAENTSQADIQGIEIKLVKLNNNWQKPTMSVLAGNFTGGGAALQTNPDKGRANKRRINDIDRTSNGLTMDKNMHECMDPDETQIFL